MGAPESNAGDDYHFWWAASRALALIAPDAGARLVVIEGLPRIDDPDDEYEIVDVAEYRGATDFATASAVHLSQLKYSTRHPDRAWTTAQLTRKRHRGRSGGSPRSVVSDLARTYQKLVFDQGRDSVTQKVKIRLVSNQPGDALLLESVAAAAAWVREHPAVAKRATLLAAMSPEQRAVIRALSDATDHVLTSQGFCDFLSVLDLSETGSLDRSALARGVQASLAEMSQRGRDSSLRLFDLVRREALPESTRRGLTAADVLAELGVASQQDLYPAPTLLTEVAEPLPSPGPQALAEAAVSHLGKVVIAHGDAGAGKTTAIQQLARHLPPGSHVLVYDCFGAGSYLAYGEERYPPQRFVMQVCNELAQVCGTPLLLDAPSLEPDLWRTLSQRLAMAAATLADDAVLVLAVDAADNAAVAAAERSTVSFLPGLLGLRLPSRVVVMLTARSHRVELLGASGGYSVPVEPFDDATSAANLRRHWSDSTEEECTEFHERTTGNPRVQFYVLAQADLLGWELPELLDACESTPEPFFKDLVDSALDGSGAGQSGQRWLATLLALARPIDMTTLADALGVDRAAVSAFAGGLTPGVVVVDGGIRFRDEDFETYVRGAVDPAAVVAAHNKLADLFLARRHTDGDAAAHVAEHLHAAGRHEEVLDLVLAEGAPQGIADGFRREQVQGRRLDLALLAAVERDDAAVAVRIAARGCQSSSRVDALSRMVESHLDLVSLYSDVDLLRSYALAQSQDGWLGPINMRLAATLSRDPERRKWALEALENAEAWLHRWTAGPNEETRHWDVDAEAAASASEAIFRLHGVEETVRWLRRWRPAAFVAEVAAELARRVAAEIEPETLRETLENAAVPLMMQAPFLAYTTSPARAAPPDWIEAVVAAAVARKSPSIEPWHARLLDAVIRYGDRDIAASLSARWAYELPGYAFAFSTHRSEGTTALRFHAAAAALAGRNLDADALIPASLQPPTAGKGSTGDPRGRERENWTSKVEAIGAISVLATRAAAGDRVATDVAAAVDAALTARLEKAEHRWFKYDQTYPAWAPIAAEAVADSDAPVGLLTRLADAAPTLVREGAPGVWLDLAEVLASRPAHADRAVDLCSRAAAATASGEYSTPDRLDLCARAASVAHSLAPALGRHIFDQALSAASGINDDAARLLSVHAELATRGAVPAAQRAEIAESLVRGAEELARHVTDERVMPYRAVACAATRLDASVGLEAVSRWDDEAREAMSSTLPAALLGAVDSGSIRATDALALDHLVENDNSRLTLQLALLGRLPTDAAGTPAARSGAVRAFRWLRSHVPASDQPGLARRLLDSPGGDLLDHRTRAELQAIGAMSLATETKDWPTWRTTSGGDTAAQELLEAASTRTWSTLGEDIKTLTTASVHDESLLTFASAVLEKTPSAERGDALAAIVAIEDWPSADTLVRVLADSLDRWRNWPGLGEWSAAALLELLELHLPQLVAWHDNPQGLIARLRSFGDDGLIRRAILHALPAARPQLTALGWHNIAMALSLLCTPEDAARAITGLLTDGHLPESTSDNARDDASPRIGPVPMMLWSALGHPRRSVRWRAAHAVRDLLLLSDDRARSQELTAEFIALLDLPGAGRYRARELHFYPLSAGAMALTALARVAEARPGQLRLHADALVRVATSHDLPHAQIRELARAAALACVPPNLISDELRSSNQPTARLTERTRPYFNDRRVSEDRRYRFDEMDTIPYWYSPLARVFDLPVDAVAERAERWILDEWHLGEDDWMTDVRELRDERSWDRMSHRQGTIPPEENLRLYLELHALLTAAGELIDSGQAVTRADWGTGDSWNNWLKRYLPASTATWRSELRSPVPVQAPLFGQLPALEEWDAPSDAEFDSLLALEADQLPASAVVAAHTEITRSGAYGSAYVFSALVVPDHAEDLQRALAAASNPMDFKLPDEDEDQFEIEHGRFILRGWLSDPSDDDAGLDEHDPYAYGMRTALPLPGRVFRQSQSASPGPSGLTLSTLDGTNLATATQWSDPDTGREKSVTSSGYCVTVDRQALLAFLAATGNNLIVEVQIGRHRSGADGYRIPRSRIYLVDATGHVTAR